MLQDFIRNASTKAKVVAICGVLIAILIIIISFVLILSNNNHHSNISILNYEEITGHLDRKTEVEDNIWLKLLTSNNSPENFDSSKTYSAVIRNDTFASYPSEDNVTRQNYIVDIEELRQSVAITSYINTEKTFFSKNIDLPSITIACPFPSYVIYENSLCTFESPNERLEDYLPYTTSLSDGTSLKVSLRRYNQFQEYANEPYLAVSVNICNDESKKNDSRVAVRSWIKSLNLDPNDYHMEILEQCN